MSRRHPLQHFRALLLLGSLLAPALVTAAVPDYRDLDAVLARNVRNGFVDYDGIRQDPAFGRFVTGLGTTDPADLETPGDRMAFLVNAYNALAIQGILDGGSPSTRLGRSDYFKRRKFRLLGQETTLEDLEQDRIIPEGDPRVHFALVCGSLSCPRLASRAYLPGEVESQLDEAARAFVNDGTRNRFDPGRRIAFVSRIFESYGPDFAARSGSLQQYLAGYAADPAVAEILRQDGFQVRYLDDDWGLNGVYRGRPE